jgi:hypothetical protein
MEILLAVAAWIGISGILAAGWARFFRKAGPTPRQHASGRQHRDVA